MLVDAALSFCNHVLTQESWARDRLQPFSGLTTRLVAGAFSFACTVSPLGFLKPCSAQDAADVTVTIPGDSLWRLSQGREALLSVARIEGRADFADALSFVLRHLRWDVEADLAPYLGDILSRRLVSGTRRLVETHERCLKNASENLAEYLREETRTLASPSEVTAFGAAVAETENTVLALEHRIARLTI